MKGKAKILVMLHILLMIYSINGICSKLAAQYPFFSIRFCFFYGIVILLLGFYAIGWQQIIRHLPLSIAFANKSVTVIWGMIWSVLLFDETITWTRLLGVIFVVIGVIIFLTADKKLMGFNE